MTTATPTVDDTPATSGPAEPAPQPTRKRRVPHWVIALVVGVLVVLLGGGGAVFGVTEQLASHVSRIPGVFAGLTNRPAQGAGQTYLLVGTDGQAQRSADAITLVNVSRDGRRATVTSVPGNSPVGSTTVSGAYASGGANQLVKSVEQLTRIRVNHVGVVDFAGFPPVVDAVRGIDVKGQHMNGAQALAYMRAATAASTDRVQRQQDVFKALVAKAASNRTLSNPFTAYGFANTLSRNVSMDSSLSNNGLRVLVWNLRGLRASNITFKTAPTVSSVKPGA